MTQITPLIVKESSLKAEAIKREINHRVEVQKVIHRGVGQVLHHHTRNLMDIEIVTDLRETGIEIVTKKDRLPTVVHTVLNLKKEEKIIDKDTMIMVESILRI